jgi:YD repeat-containing protein
MIFGQAPSLAWVELADTVYMYREDTQDTLVYIQSRSGSVRRFDLYFSWGSNLSLAAYDSVYLDGSGRVQRIRSYMRVISNDSLLWEQRFSYPGSPALRIETIHDTSPTVLEEKLCYGLSMFEGAVVWRLGLRLGFVGGPAIPTWAYPAIYRIEQVGDSVLVRSFSDNEARAVARRTRPSACDTFIFYGGPANGPFMPYFGGKICHTNGRIDSIISPFSRLYRSYDANNRLIRAVEVDNNRADTTFYTYDSWGRLIETRQSGVENNRPYQIRYLLRYRGAPASLSSALGGDCLFWDAIQRRGALTCQPAGAFTALRLYDLQGRIVWQGSVRGAETFEVPLTLPPGLYYLHTDVGTARLYLMP